MSMATVTTLPIGRAGVASRRHAQLPRRRSLRAVDRPGRGHQQLALVPIVADDDDPGPSAA